MFETLTITQFIGKNLVYMPTCHSTNAICMQLLKTNQISNGDLVITNEQTAGKGQRGNIWIAEPFKNLTFSFVLEIKCITHDQLFNLSMAISLGIVEYLKSLQHPNNELFTIKWPNDIYFKDYKIGGMLIETIQRDKNTISAVIGIGLNINQIDFGRLNASSLKLIFQKEFDLALAIAELAFYLEKKLDNTFLTDFFLLKNGYIKSLYKFGISSTYRKIDGTLFQGKIVDVDISGKIVIDSEGELQYFDKKEMVFLR